MTLDLDTTPSLDNPADADRVLNLPGALNLRDVGGYPAADGRRVRRRALLRSAAMHGLGDEARAALAALPLRTVVDLREDTEAAHEPNALDGLTAATRRIPIYSSGAVVPSAEDVTAAAGTGTDGAAAAGNAPGSGAAAADGVRAAAATGVRMDLADIYDFMIDNKGDRLTAAVLALAEPGALPAVVHCSAGKDRTGLTIMLVLDLLGVDDDVIASDYALTAELLHDEAIAALRRLGTVTAADGQGEPLPANLMACPPELIRRALARVRAGHGGARGYLLAHGATPAQLDALTEALLVDAEPA
ncbi:tyrosine-protein phosphatase [Frankia sp. CNm7]|uniref:Tyrosine-protein phosphatase n=1 Tax=Frankia nepalensis TaxID=1836974 RepID=A0A937RFA0_9ACTN|nr:tyrosine-protein phosphatase [Frankia nepalensis]MBL7500458.1 tyrosine-protein phosphatase [Frankia nepalensis]MBL7511181.1 tyrosine-protein phosphatase [Frankia nepalensis]MBL7524450.1 tyrosine-protein phosphatase [Frankia nepalensis]MBL7627784.1 tyrosine-protein phosphatase [Frankia nepalensis]